MRGLFQMSTVSLYNYAKIIVSVSLVISGRNQYLKLGLHPPSSCDASRYLCCPCRYGVSAEGAWWKDFTYDRPLYLTCRHLTYGTPFTVAVWHGVMLYSLYNRSNTSSYIFQICPIEKYCTTYTILYNNLN